MMGRRCVEAYIQKRGDFVLDSDVIVLPQSVPWVSCSTTHNI